MRIDVSHAEFAGRIVKCHNGILTDPNRRDDQNGHGTHVAVIAGASGLNLQGKGLASAMSFYIDQVGGPGGVRRPCTGGETRFPSPLMSCHTALRRRRA